MPGSTVSQPGNVDALLKAIREQGDIEAAFDAVTDAGEQEAAIAQLGSALQDTKNTPAQARRTIIFLLFQLGGPSVVAHLGKALVNDPDPDVRREALGPLERLDPRTSLLLFQQALDDEDKDIRQAAFVSLGIAVRACVLDIEDSSTQESTTHQQLRRIKIENFERLLNREVLNREESLISKAAAEALGIVSGSEAVTVLCSFLNDELTRQSQIEVSGGQSDEERVRQSEQAALRAEISWSAITALQTIAAPQAVPCLDATLRRNVNGQVRQVTADALGRLALPTGIKPLFHAALLDQSSGVQRVAREALTRIPDWQEKAKQLLEVLKESPLQRGQLPAMVLIETIQLSEDELTNNPHALTDFLVAQALDQSGNERMLSLCASLIVASANGSLVLAGERIDKFQKDNNIPRESLQPLRVEVGGPTALKPLLTQLEDNLETYFQEPIKRLNDDTQRVWRQTMRIAQIGFALRALMSVTLFIIGAYLVVDSYRRFVSGTLDMEGFFGPGVAFVAGLGTMLTMIYTGPLREIKKSVSDVGAADAAFMAYIHRLLQVSHTFSYYYLGGDATFEELETAGKLIEDTLTETVEIIRPKEDKDKQKQGPKKPSGNPIS